MRRDPDAAAAVVQGGGSTNTGGLGNAAETRRLENDRAMRPVSALELDLSARPRSGASNPRPKLALALGERRMRPRSWRCLRIIRSATSPVALWYHRAPAPERRAPLQMKTGRREAAST